jgi:type II secretory pathway component GspD/PulD (secretin)
VIEQKKSIGIPIVQRIPLLNVLFGRRGETRLRNNLFVLIKASIVIVKEEEKINFP